MDETFVVNEQVEQFENYVCVDYASSDGLLLEYCWNPEGCFYK